MKRFLWTAVLAGAACLLGRIASAQQSYIIQNPGQMPTYAYPTYNGGLTIQTPGQMPTYVTPNFNGYTVQQPGQIPSYITVPQQAPVVPFVGQRRW